MSFIIFLIFLLSCKKTEVIPSLKTSEVMNILSTSAKGGGEIINDNGAEIIKRGVCWSTASNPSVGNNFTDDGPGSGVFTSDIIGLQENTTYYIRAYATNHFGTYYGQELTFKTLYSSQIVDVDWNIYNTVQIGTQTWMSENLITTKYNDGTSIPTVTSNTSWDYLISLGSPAFCWYKDDIGNRIPYGAFYNWPAVNSSKKLCPLGWHVPSDDEWKTLEKFLGMSQAEVDLTGWRGTDQGYQLKSSSGWPSGNGSNIVGFSAIGSSNRDLGFTTAGYVAFWWSSTPYMSSFVWYRNLLFSESRIKRGYASKFSEALSVRCIKDN